MTYNRPDLAVKVDTTSLRGYTMKQIGGLDSRISRLEYYSVLQALDTDATSLSIANTQTGIQRFKTGIFSDPFNDFSLSDISDPEFRIAIDSSASVARPRYTTSLSRYQLVASQSSGYSLRGRYGLVNYSEEKMEGNPTATTYRNPAEGYYSFMGDLALNPNFDNYIDTVQAAPQNITVNEVDSFQNLLSSGLGITTQDISTVAAKPVLTASTSTTNYWSQTSTTTVKDLAVTAAANPVSQDLGDFVTNVTNLPYMNSRTIAIYATGMMPGHTLYGFFDKVPVSQYCAPAYVNPIYADENGNVDRSKCGQLGAGGAPALLLKNGNYGDPIVSNMYGMAYLIFNLPAGMFRTGERSFVLTNVQDLADTGGILTSATQTYTASAQSITRQNNSLTIIQPTFNWNTATSQTTSNYTTRIDPPPQGGGGNDERGGGSRGSDGNSCQGSDPGNGGIGCGQGDGGGGD